MKRLAFLAAISMHAACGGGGAAAGVDAGGGADAGGGDPLEPDEIALAIGGASCNHLAACCTEAEFMERTLNAANLEECVTAFGGLIQLALVTPLEESIAMGRVVYHADRMGACVDAISERSCADGLGDGILSPDCEDPFEGQVALDGVCASAFDCISEYCSGDSIDFDGVITYGTCATAPTVGEACDDSDCESGAFCDSSGPEEICAAPRVDGSACTADDECASGACELDLCGVRTECDGVD